MVNERNEKLQIIKKMYAWTTAHSSVGWYCIVLPNMQSNQPQVPWSLALQTSRNGNQDKWHLHKQTKRLIENWTSEKKHLLRNSSRGKTSSNPGINSFRLRSYKRIPAFGRCNKRSRMLYKPLATVGETNSGAILGAKNTQTERVLFVWYNSSSQGWFEDTIM